MRIHMRDKQVDPSLDVRRLARACAGFTGAEIMGLMNRAAARAVRDKQKVISEDAIFKVRPGLRSCPSETYARGCWVCLPERWQAGSCSMSTHMQQLWLEHNHKLHMSVDDGCCWCSPGRCWCGCYPFSCRAGTV